MNFRPELAEAVMSGRKTITRRAVSDNPNSPYSLKRAFGVVGKRIAICPGRGKPRIGTAEVIRVTPERFNPRLITDREAMREGFVGNADFVRAWVDLHGDADPLTVWRIELSDPAPPEPKGKG